MPYLAMSCAAGVITGMLMQALRGRSVKALFLLPVRVKVAGFFGVAFYTLALVQAVDMAPQAESAQVVLINYLWPVLMVLLSLILLPEPHRPQLVIFGAVTGFAGVLLIIGPEAFSRPPESYFPHALALSGASLWALYSVLIRRWQVPEEQNGSVFHFLVCGLLAAILAFPLGDWSKVVHSSPFSFIWVVTLGIGPIGLAYYGWEIGVKRGKVRLIAVCAYFIPVVSAALMALMFRETMSQTLIPGAVLIALGAYLARRAAVQTME
jgi:drug/metabolite transporter (DMT)-like permease